MYVNVPTLVIPIWYIEKWVKKNAEPNSALDTFVNQMLKDWEFEEIRIAVIDAIDKSRDAPNAANYMKG